MAAIDIPRIIGHRGAKASAPENTLAAIREARRQGASWVEFDVKLTADGEPILLHDETLERTTDGAGPVREAALAEIRRLDAGSWFGPAWRGEPVPTLGEALDLLAQLGMGFNLEIKPCPGREAETARVAVAQVAAHWLADRPPPIISSFQPTALAAAQAAAPGLIRGYLVKELPVDWKAEAERFACRTVHVGWRNFSHRQAAAVKAAGYQLLVWTVNDPRRARELFAWGVDAVITDRPEALGAALPTG